MIVLVILILLLAALPLLLIAPSAGRKRAAKWQGTAFAHRGLHGCGISENSIAAFEAAVQAGYGIELDVRLTKDGTVVVFHDDDLKRMTGDERRVDQLDLDELRCLRLPDGSGIPTFEEVLRCVNGRVPLLVEIKNGNKNPGLCTSVLQHLRAYKGEYIVESFNPLVLMWLRRNAPEVVRGQLVTSSENYQPGFNPVLAAALSHLILNVLARPDFVAYDVSAEHFSAPGIQRRLFKTPLAAWTVKDEQMCRELLEGGEMPIFEGFKPEIPVRK